MKIKNRNVLIKEIKEELTSNNGLILLQEKYNRKAQVILSDSDYLKTGDKIIKTIGNGTVFTIDGEEYEILHESHILAIIN